MPEISRDFDYVATRLANGDPVYDVYAGGKAPINGGGAPGIPRGRFLGRIHNRVTDGVWDATPEDGAWLELTWFHPFASRREASFFLLSFSLGATYK